MLKNITHKEKFRLLKRWMPHLVESIKKDLRNEHLKKDPSFVKRYLSGKDPSKAPLEELAEAYADAIENDQNSEELAEFISNRWILKHSDLYYFFETELSKVNSDFNELEELEKNLSLEIMEKSISNFGAVQTYLFSVMNSVVFPKEVYDLLSERANTSADLAKSEAAELNETKTLEDIRRSYENQIARLTDKYEKKLIGLQKKYAIDVESLKKQIAALQRKAAIK